MGEIRGVRRSRRPSCRTSPTSLRVDELARNRSSKPRISQDRIRQGLASCSQWQANGTSRDSERAKPSRRQTWNRPHRSLGGSSGRDKIPRSLRVPRGDPDNRSTQRTGESRTDSSRSMVQATSGYTVDQLGLHRTLE